MYDIEKAIVMVREVCKEFMDSEKIYFSDLKPAEDLKGLSGVYAVFDENNKALYVGRTKNLRRRIYGHLKGPKQGARLKNYLAKDKYFPKPNPTDFEKSFEYAREWIMENCYLKHIVIDCPTRPNCQDDCPVCSKASNMRGHVEGLLGFILNSKYIETEH